MKASRGTPCQALDGGNTQGGGGGGGIGAQVRCEQTVRGRCVKARDAAAAVVFRRTMNKQVGDTVFRPSAVVYRYTASKQSGDAAPCQALCSSVQVHMIK